MKEESLGNSRTLPHWTADTPVTADNLNKMVDAIQTALDEVNVRLSTAGGTIHGELNVTGSLKRAGNAVYDTGNKPTPAEIGALGDTGEFLPQGADLNTYRSPGCWQWSRSGLTQDFQNAPIQNGYGIFTVTVGRGFVEQQLALMYVDEEDSYRAYKRTYGNDTLKWTPWVMSYDTDNKPTAADVGAVPQKKSTLDLLHLSKEVYYPVVFNSSTNSAGGAIDYELVRSAHQDGHDYPNLYARIIFKGIHWGVNATYFQMNYSITFGNDDQLIGKITVPYEENRLVIYLKGGYTYDLIASGLIMDSFNTQIVESEITIEHKKVQPIDVSGATPVEYGVFEVVNKKGFEITGTQYMRLKDTHLTDDGERVYSPSNPPSQRGVISDLVQFNQDGTYLFWSELPFEYTHYRFSLPNISFLVAQQEGARLSVFYLDSEGVKHSRVSTNDNDVCGFNLNPREKPVYWVRV